jgi:hypothetical protein
MSSGVQVAAQPSAVQVAAQTPEVPAATPESVFLVHNSTSRSELSASLLLKIDSFFGLKKQTYTARKPPVLPWPDIGHFAKWSVSSFKFGFGPECLQDQDPDTFWQ